MMAISESKMPAKVVLLAVLSVLVLMTGAPAQGPPSQPPGEVQSSLDKPPQKKESLTFEDRRAWQEILKWPEYCGSDPADLRRPGTSHLPKNPSGLRFWQLEPKKYLVEVKCQAGAYNDLQLYLLYDETTAPPTSRLLRFERYDPGAKIIVEDLETTLSGYAEFHPQRRELTVWTQAQDWGECHTWSKYRITEDKGVLLEIRAQAPDGTRKYKRILQDPATYPIIIRPPIKAYLGKEDKYREAGTIQGGELADGLDLFNISFAKHDTLERLVFDLHQWNKEGNPPAARPSFFLVDYEYYPFRLVFEIEGIRMVHATFPDFAGSDYLNNLYVAGSLGDSGVKYALTLKKPIEFEIYEQHQPAKIVVDIKGAKVTRENFPAVYSLRTPSDLPPKSVISIQESLSIPFKEARILQSRNKSYLVEEGYYKTKEEALRRQKYLAKHLKEELKGMGKNISLFIEKREVDAIPK
jgi:hypothetical protein